MCVSVTFFTLGLRLLCVSPWGLEVRRHFLVRVSYVNVDTWKASILTAHWNKVWSVSSLQFLNTTCVVTKKTGKFLYLNCVSTCSSNTWLTCINKYIKGVAWDFVEGVRTRRMFRAPKKFQTRGVWRYAPLKNLKLMISEMPFPTISEGHFNKKSEGVCSN